MIHGTILCGVDETTEGRAALEHALELSDRLRMRLVVAHVGEVRVRGGDPVASMQDDVFWRERRAAVLLVDRLVREFGLGDHVVRRVAIGDACSRLAQIAGDEAADVILVGARQRGRLRRRIECGFAEQLQRATTVPVLVASTPLPAAASNIAV